MIMFWKMRSKADCGNIQESDLRTKQAILDLALSTDGHERQGKGYDHA